MELQRTSSCETPSPSPPPEIPPATTPCPSSRTLSVSDTTAQRPSSLDILKPEPWVPRPRQKIETPTTLLLEDLTTRLINVFNTQDWANPLIERHMLPTFHAYIDHATVRTRTLEEHIDFHKRMHLLNPGYVYQLVRADADVDEEKGLALVWATLKVVGSPTEIQRESITILWWRRKQGHWRGYKQTGVRGVEWYDH